MRRHLLEHWQIVNVLELVVEADFQVFSRFETVENKGFGVARLDEGLVRRGCFDVVVVVAVVVIVMASVVVVVVASVMIIVMVSVVIIVMLGLT